MTNELVEQIVRRVLAEMQQQSRPAAPAPPPARKSPEPTAPAPKASAPAGAGPARRVFITADALERKLRALGEGAKAVDLAHNEHLTPAAMDVVHQRRLNVRRQPRPIPRAEVAPGPAEAAAPCSAASDAKTLGVVVRTSDDKVNTVLAGLEADGMGVMVYAPTDCWIVNVRALCEAVTAGHVAGGVVLVPLAAEALVLANKIRGIRAVQGAGPDCLPAVVDRLAPNVLVIEHATATFHEVRTMVRSFAAGLAGQASNTFLVDAIDKLERS